MLNSFAEAMRLRNLAAKVDRELDRLHLGPCPRCEAPWSIIDHQEADGVYHEHVLNHAATCSLVADIALLDRFDIGPTT